MIALSPPGGSPPGGSVRPVESVAEFVRRCGVDLLRFAYLLCGDRHRAEDLLQDVLLAMYRRFGDAVPLDNPVGYARRALANANVSWSRRATNREIATGVFADESTTGGDDPAQRDMMWQALRRLPVRQRTVLVLRFYADATDDEIATALGCRRGTVRSLASRGLAALRTDPTISVEGAP